MPSIGSTEVKKLWGLSAGTCAYPGCNCNCVEFFDQDDPTILGEMAHVIARAESGPRAEEGSGSDKYENLILLCPTHHTIIDKAPAGKFPANDVLKWKEDHEKRVRSALQSPTFEDKHSLFLEIAKLLSENYQVWATYGPDSEEAKRNPMSNASDIWTLRKVARIVPNNRRIINLIENNKRLLSNDEYKICCKFAEHAEGFERNCYSRQEGVPKFPVQFEEMVSVQK